ncbi:hypothetical protein [Paractinoplanes rishiriensis]|uniref:SMI1/KNR4 family protein n=1 Tax=Paractinoplanes rishiriensis TaxID=1050105 RepID=A0A919JQT8_9ACTN|nr:hypothetical protein [Actinoplanes rishiriensis]GIE93195.1 hypothetical protein Ari01nite_06600 [Actinoplanes rishiriensis]
MTAAELLAASGRFPLSPGLTDAEFDAVEREFGFTFAADHRAFLAAGVPTGRGWPDWRGTDRDRLREQAAFPVEGVLFDVGENEFWYDGWGPRPATADQAVAAARFHLATAPRMVPLFTHRYLPAGLNPHPVLSIYQTDVVHYGNDLADWLNREFGLGEPATDRRRPTVPFWRELL